MRISDWSSDVCSPDLSTYEFYCEAGKRLDRRFEKLGAERLAPRVDCDIDYEEAAESWIGAIVEQLAAEASPARVPASAGPTRAAPTAAHAQRHPFPAQVIDIIALVGAGSTKVTRHDEFSRAGAGRC